MTWHVKKVFEKELHATLNRAKREVVSVTPSLISRHCWLITQRSRSVDIYFVGDKVRAANPENEEEWYEEAC